MKKRSLFTKTPYLQYIAVPLKILAIFILLASLLLFYRFISYSFGNDFINDPYKLTLTLLALSHKNREIYVLYLVFCSFYVSMNFLNSKLSKLLLNTLLSVLFIWSFYRVLNLFHIYFTGGHIEKEFILHIEKGSLGFLFDIKAVLLLVVPIIFTFISYRLLRLLKINYENKDKLIILILFFIPLSLSVFYLKNWRDSIRVNLLMNEMYYKNTTTATLPENILYLSLTRTKDQTLFQNFLPDKVHGKLKDLFGLHLNSKLNYPLFRNKIFSDPVAFPAKEKVSQPNIIIFFMESLSSSLLSYYNNNLGPVSPNLDSFAKESCVILPHYNATTPTINGFVSTLCSHYPVYGHNDWGNDGLVNSDKKLNYDLLCLPEILKEREYNTYNMVAADPYISNQYTFLKANGVDHIYGILDIEKYLHKPPLGRTGFSDRQIFTYFIENLSKSTFTEPFLSIISTTDLHPPFTLPDDSIKFSQSNGSSLLHIVHNLDDIFGDFWKWFKQSSYAGNTIVIVTADHAIFPGVEYEKIMNDKNKGYYDQTPFIIYDPTHLLPNTINTTSTSVDILPSLLHLLDININNPFEGLSVFDSDGRKNHQNVLGSHEYLYFYMINNSSNQFRLESAKCDGDTAINDLPDDIFSECDYFSWWKYKGWLISNDRIWNPSLR